MDADWLRKLVEWLVQELLELEFSEFLGDEPYERNEERQGYRNGFRERELFTRVGRVTLRVPRDLEGRFSTQAFECYQQEVRRRSRVVRIFPNRASCLRLTTALAMEQSEDWLKGHRYLNMELLEEKPLIVDADQLVAEPAISS